MSERARVEDARQPAVEVARRGRTLVEADPRIAVAPESRQRIEGLKIELTPHGEF